MPVVVPIVAVVVLVLAVALRRRQVANRRPQRRREPGWGPLAAMGEVVDRTKHSGEALPAVAEPHQAYLRIVDAPTTERRGTAASRAARRRRPSRPATADPANAVPLKELLRRTTTV